MFRREMVGWLSMLSCLMVRTSILKRGVNLSSSLPMHVK